MTVCLLGRFAPILGAPFGLAVFQESVPNRVDRQMESDPPRIDRHMMKELLMVHQSVRNLVAKVCTILIDK